MEGHEGEQVGGVEVELSRLVFEEVSFGVLQAIEDGVGVDADLCQEGFAVDGHVGQSTRLGGAPFLCYGLGFGSPDRDRSRPRGIFSGGRFRNPLG